MKGVVEKCTFCDERIARGQVPACVEVCDAGAMHFGDLNNPEHKVSQLIKSPYAFRLLEKLNTKPKVYYLSTKDWVRKLADNYLPGRFKPITKAT